MLRYDVTFCHICGEFGERPRMIGRHQLAIEHNGAEAAQVSPAALESDGPVISYPDTAILELAHVAAWLRVSERTVERLDIPFSLLGKRTKRYLARDVIAYLEAKRITA